MLVWQLRSRVPKESQILVVQNLVVSFILTELRIQQDIMLDNLVEAYNEKIHPTLISQEQLRNEFIHIRSHLPKHTRLPQELNLMGFISGKIRKEGTVILAYFTFKFNKNIIFLDRSHVADHATWSSIMMHLMPLLKQ